MHLLVRVVEIKGNCPVYDVGDRFTLEDGYKLVSETPVCMHSLASILPYHIAMAKGVPPNRMGLAHKDRKDGKAYVQCLDPVSHTAGGTAIF